MSLRLELSDASVTEWTTLGVPQGQLVLLNESAFFPGGGGQVPDEGTVQWENGVSCVREVVFDGSDILVRIDYMLVTPSIEFHCTVNAARRHLIMRTHTAFHVLASVLAKHGSLVTGCHLEAGYGRGDFTEVNATGARAAIEKANELLAEAHEVKVEWISRREFVKNSDLVLLATDLVPDVDPVRLINIVGIDRQADGGTHVENTAEVGQILFERFENKGARNKRITFSIV